MKRSADDSDDQASKRPRQENPTGDSDPFRPSLQRKATDLLTNGVDESGFIQATIIMKWPTISGRVRVEFEVLEDGSTKRFVAAFAGVCPTFFGSVGLTFEIGDTLQLCLKEASLEKINPSKPKALPVQLNYTNGVCLKFLTKKTPPAIGMVVDYWKARANIEKVRRDRASGDAPFQDDWFSTPAFTANPATAVTAEAKETDLVSASQSAPPVLEPSSSPPSRELPSRAPDPKKASPSSNNDAAKASQVTSSTEATLPNRPPSNSERKSHSPAIAVDGNANTDKLGKKAMKAARRKAERAARELALLTAASDDEGIGDQIKRVETQPTDAVHDFVQGSSRDSASNIPPKKTSTPLTSTPSEPSRRPASPVKQASKAKAPLLDSVSRQASPTKAASDTALQLEAGCQVHGNLVYTPLRDLGPGRTYHVAGVVLSQTSPSRTRSEEWSTKVTLVDPSNVDQGDLDRGFNITCFTKQRMDNIPDAAVDNILMLRGVMVSDWHGSYNGSCPSFKVWSWTLYEPKTGSTKHGGPSTSSFNSAFTASAASTQLDMIELQYCIRLGDWWSAVLQAVDKKLSQAIVVQIGGEGASTSAAIGRTTQRLHRLIKDASPSAPPAGYFDCTVEILHGHRSSDNVYSLYVTDYTSNEGLSAIEANWCKPSLAHMVLRMETWYDAATYAETDMKKGDFFLLPNARMKMDAAGYLEATISEVRKFQKLDVDELEDSLHLRALLSRKIQWEKAAEAAGTHEFPHRLFSEANPQQHFKCTVQLLSISEKDDRKYIYVTDYTSRPDLAPVHIDTQIMRVLDSDRIVKIALFDEQAKVASELEPGDYLAIRNLRLRSARGGADGDLVGRLGGDDRLIFKLQAKVSASEELRELLKRKKAFEDDHRAKQQSTATKSARRKKVTSETTTKAPSPKRSSANIKDAPVTDGKKAPPRPFSIKRVLAYEKCPCRFRIIARITSLWPPQLEDCVALYCTSCKEDIPPQHRICTKCDDDMLDTHVQPTFRFFFQLEDEQGDVLQVGVIGHSSLLRGLKPCDLREDSDAFEEFKERLLPVVGDLVEDDRVKYDSSGCRTPWLDLIIGSWVQEETGEREHVLMDITVLEEDE